MSVIIAPSILSADFAFLKNDIDFVNVSDADWFHVDVMDGVFVPNISFGFPVMAALKKHAKKTLDVHLMIKNADAYLEQFKNMGAEIISVHYEAVTHLHRTVQNIKALGMKASVALNPHTSVELLKPIINELDMVLLMSVNPGFGGQEFIPKTLEKVIQLKQIIQNENPNCLIEIDGGVDTTNASALVQAGANALVAGNAIFGAPDRNVAIQLMKHGLGK